MKYITYADGQQRASLWIRYVFTREEYQDLRAEAKKRGWTVRELLENAIDRGVLEQFQEEYYDEDAEE